MGLALHILLLLSHYLIVPLVASHRITAVIVFGDSTVDAGNNNYVGTIARANFPPYGRDFPGGLPTGRFCNGRLATDFISEALGLPPTIPAYLDPAYTIHDFARGVSFASAATGFDTATSDVLSVIPLRQELEFFREYQMKLTQHAGKNKAKQIISEAVYIVSVGANDFIENYFSPAPGNRRREQFTVEEYVDFVVSLAADFFVKLHRLGARKVSFTGLIPIGCLPWMRATNAEHPGECLEEYNEVAREFNDKMRALVGRLCAALPEFKLRFAPLSDLFLQTTQDPSSFGFETAVRGCCGTGTIEAGLLCNEWSPDTCEDADKYMFWDSIHPSERMNQFFSNQTLRTSLAEFI